MGFSAGKQPDSKVSDSAAEPGPLRELHRRAFARDAAHEIIDFAARKGGQRLCYLPLDRVEPIVQVERDVVEVVPIDGRRQNLLDKFQVRAAGKIAGVPGHPRKLELVAFFVPVQDSDKVRHGVMDIDSLFALLGVIDVDTVDIRGNNIDHSEASGECCGVLDMESTLPIKFCSRLFVLACCLVRSSIFDSILSKRSRPSSRLF